jgi:arabinofuranosyltransferase
MIISSRLGNTMRPTVHVGRGAIGAASQHWLRAVPFLLLTLLVGRIAWAGFLTEDAFISYRCLENLGHGLGMTWATDLRSQPYTHPLWMLAHMPLLIVIPDVKIVSFLLCFACTGGVLWSLHRNYSGYRPFYSYVVLVPLLLSKCFVEWSTSGLENPLAHLCAALFFPAFLGRHARSFSMDNAAFLAAAAFLNRHDNALFYALPIAVMFFSRRQYLADATSLLIAALPVAAWFAFAVFYYGQALPDTFYAKLTAGIDKDFLAAQGMTYLARFAERDMPSFLIIVAGLVMAARVALSSAVPIDTRVRFAAAASSVLLFVAYVVHAGGDYMEGRFFSTPFIVAVVLLAESVLAMHQQQTASAPTRNVLPRTICIGVMAGFLSSICMPDLILGPPHIKDPMWKYGFCDIHTHQWNFYLKSWSHKEKGLDDRGMAIQRKTLEVPSSDSFFEYNGAAGVNGFYSGPSYGMIDAYGLVDPVMSRLPAANYMPGHFYRVAPAGYEKARRTGDTSELEPALRSYYEILRTVKSGPLFSADRIAAAVTFATGRYDHYVHDYALAMSERPDRRNDFWTTQADRHARLKREGNVTGRGPIANWYSRQMLAREQE